jgi:RNA polymerase sigma-70 factor (ECF subfamily)
MSTAVEITWLLAAVAKGDAVAFERLYGATCAKLYGVMGQAYLQIWRDAGDYDPARSSPLAWMVAVARRLAIDVARGPQPPAAEGEPDIVEADEGPGTVPRHELTDDLKQLLTCIGRLEPDRQRMLLLAYYGAFSREQLSAKLDMPIDLLRASLRRSLLEIEGCFKS